MHPLHGGVPGRLGRGLPHYSTQLFLFYQSNSLLNRGLPIRPAASAAFREPEPQLQVLPATFLRAPSFSHHQGFDPKQSRTLSSGTHQHLSSNQVTSGAFIPIAGRDSYRLWCGKTVLTSSHQCSSPLHLRRSCALSSIDLFPP